MHGLNERTKGFETRIMVMAYVVQVMFSVSEVLSLVPGTHDPMTLKHKALLQIALGGVPDYYCTKHQICIRKGSASFTHHYIYPLLKIT